MSMVTNGWIVRDSAEQRLIEVNNNLVLMFLSYSCPSRILGSDGRQNVAEAGARGLSIVALSIRSHEQTQ